MFPAPYCWLDSEKVKYFLYKIKYFLVFNKSQYMLVKCESSNRNELKTSGGVLHEDVYVLLFIALCY